MASEQLAVLFADVCDSTTIYESVGDARALAAIRSLFDVLTARVKAHDGKIVKTLGDGMVCEFGDADSAFRAACDIQEAAVAAEAGAGPKLTIKVGLNWGPVVTERGDVFGDTVNVCARLVALAGPHQVLTTEETVDALSLPLRTRCRHLYALGVRGRVEEVEVSEVLWRLDDPDVTKELSRSSLKAAARVDWILKLSYGGDTVVVEPSGSIRLGRGKANDVVVPSTLASRVHARIYGRGGNFVIVDQSSNGTFVAIDGHSRELQLRREEAVLGERGYIGLGGSATGTGDHVLRYRLESRKPA
ncbi:MAG TPA: adenylate/guanylate cyclase domain-containing protein [Burkholderiales bacterium]|nr:adenylate/guanylate cyclase domain-containing protein [Burkholderiales bacterium]